MFETFHCSFVWYDFCLKSAYLGSWTQRSRISWPSYTVMPCLILCEYWTRFTNYIYRKYLLMLCHLHRFWSAYYCLFMQDSSINLGANSGYNHLTFALLEKPPNTVAHCYIKSFKSPIISKYQQTLIRNIDITICSKSYWKL